MTRNPFKHLQDQREAKEAERRRQQEAERRARKRKKELNKARFEAAARCDGMVMKVLEHLREAAYPTLRLGGPVGYQDYQVHQSTNVPIYQCTGSCLV